MGAERAVVVPPGGRDAIVRFVNVHAPAGFDLRLKS